ncbi:MAG: efflux RND transporter periplasmic adaptor subunit [Cyanobacteria bacterium J06600_6]
MSLKFSFAKRSSTNRFVCFACLVVFPGLLILTTGCESVSPINEQSDSPSEKSQTIAVDVAVAKEGSLEREIQYIGTTFPVQEVSLRSRVEGQVLDLKVDVGDRVEKGQILARIDNSINKASVLEAEAELEALRSEVTSFNADVSEGQTQVKQAKIALQQAKNDLVRSNQLVKEGAVTKQSAEQAQNAVDNAQQALESAQQQVANRSSAVVAAQRRVAAQSALLAQEQQQESFTVLRSPVTGSVLERVLEPGDLAQVGDEVLQLGDFSQIEVQVEISELELAKIRVGQTAQVKLDARPEQTIIGEVTRISLAADTTARLVPVKVIIPNTDRRIGRGLLARVNFSQQGSFKVVIPETAIQIGAQATEISNDYGDTATIFIIQGEGENTTVTAREVRLGDRANSQVEIISGLEPGAKFVVRSSGDLAEGDRVNLSFLSE